MYGTRERVLDALAKGMTDKEAALHCRVTVNTVTYHRRMHTTKANIRQKYTPDIIETLIRAKADGNLQWALDTYGIPVTSVSRLIDTHEASKARLPVLKERGWFNPKSTKECYIAGLGRNQVAKSIEALAEMNLSLKIIQGFLFLYYRSDAMVTRFHMTFDDEVAILKDPKRWLTVNKARLKDGWMVVKKIPVELIK